MALGKEQVIIHREISRLEELPTLPAIAVELIERWNDPDLSIPSIVKIISLDPGLSAHVIQVANSAEVGVEREITDLGHAASLLGLNTLRCLTLGITVVESFSDQAADWAKNLDLEEFWRHSLAVAISSEMLAKRFDYPQQGEAFLAGLLHDIGKIGLLAIYPEDYAKAMEEAAKGDRSLLDSEKKAFSITHTDAGKWIAENWGLPEKFRRAIWLHHQPTEAPDSTEEPPSLENIVHVADHVARRARIGNAGNHRFEHDDLWLRRRFGFEDQDLREFTAELLSRVQSVGNELSIATPTLRVYLKALEDANKQLSARGFEAEDELRRSREQNELLQILSSIAHLPAHTELEVDLLARAMDLTCGFLEIRWMLLVVTDHLNRSVQGVLFKEGMKGPQTFYRVLNLVEDQKETREGSGAHPVFETLGETVLSDGQRVNLRDETVAILQSGNLVSIPMGVDKNCKGECMVDSSGSRILQMRHRENFGALLDATALLYERARLYNRIRRESELATEALQREADALRQLFHFERLASIGRLAAGAAHEINNPLAVISGKAQLLLMSEDEPKRSAPLNSIIDQTMRISKIISDLMGYARPAEPEITDTHPQTMIDNALYMANHRIPNHDVDLVLEIPEDVHSLRVDARQIEQVLVNLFVNAIQAMKNEGTLTVQAENDDSSDLVVLRISDTGPGIPADDLGKVFDPFFTTKREGEGTGLGLAVSHRIVESHGGQMTVTSREGEGTQFTIELSSAPDNQGEVLEIPREKVRKPGRRAGKKRVLVVDDEKQLSDLIRDFLQDAGYVVEQAADGMEAIGLLENKVYDILVIDIRMPRKDGLEVLEEMKGFTTGMPILVITGLASNEEIDQATSYGASKILRKPFQLDELLHAVDELTKMRSSNVD